MAKTLFSIVIPVHNKAVLTRQCLDSIFETGASVPFEVIVVDDASSDSSPEMLAGYHENVRAVRLERNSGFATACNAGARAARGNWLVFLNNDTIALPGWLDALAGYAAANPKAAAIGSKLLFPDGTIQHAGVAFSLSGDPLHIYARCAADHPAVNVSRRFQAVTAACLMVRKRVFLEVDGFDTGYHNDLEDVDLCLRLGQRGYEVHYCHESVLYHLESASRGYTDKPSASAKVYRARWGTDVKSDELDYYLEDGLLDLLRFSPERVRFDRGRRKKEAEMLQARSRQFAHLLRETVRLATYTEDRPGDGADSDDPSSLTLNHAGERAGHARPMPASVRKRIESRLRSLREELGDSLNGDDRVPPPATDQPVPSDAAEHLSYADVVADLPRLVCEVVPEDANVLVVSKGDEALLRMPGRHGWHFPRSADGRYGGFYPETSEDAVRHLEGLRADGAEFLVIPSTYLWWMDHYTGLAQHVKERYETVSSAQSGLVIDLRGDAVGLGLEDGAVAPAVLVGGSDDQDSAGGRAMSTAEYSQVIKRLKDVVDTTLPPYATVLVVSRGDDELLELGDRRAWHFPREEDGRYLGYHPAGDDEAITHLEALRAKGAEYLVFPSAAFWWLDHYAGFAEYLRARYTTLAYEPDACLVFELAEHFLSQVVQALVPDDARVAVMSRYPVDVTGLHNGLTSVLEPREAEDESIARVSALASEGVGFLAIPKSEFTWLEERSAVRRYLRSEHRFVTRQEHACELYELSDEVPDFRGDAGLQPASTAADDKDDKAAEGRQGGVRGWLKRLFGAP